MCADTFIEILHAHSLELLNHANMCCLPPRVALGLKTTASDVVSKALNSASEQLEGRKDIPLNRLLLRV